MRKYEPFERLLAGEAATEVTAIVDRDCPTVEPSTPVIHVALDMMKRGVRTMPVLDGGRAVGIVTYATLIRKVLRG